MAKAFKTKKTKRDWDEGLSALNRNAAGIDVGNAEHYVVLPGGRDPEPVQTLGSFTADLHRMVQWLKACGVETVVMQATGVYWIALFQILESKGFHVNVVSCLTFGGHSTLELRPEISRRILFRRTMKARPQKRSCQLYEYCAV